MIPDNADLSIVFLYSVWACLGFAVACLLLFKHFSQYGKRKLRPDDVLWVVNSLGELGVKIDDEFFFLYKGESLQYKGHGPFGEDRPLRWRRVHKFEFGETCHPMDWTRTQLDKGLGYTSGSPTGELDYNAGEGWDGLPVPV
jgi:hypothetical protein